MINEIDLVLQKRYANSIPTALLVDDSYVTLAMASGMENADIERKISDAIQALSK